MNTLSELAVLFRAPLLWSAIALCVVSGLIGLAGPRFLETANRMSAKSIDSNRFFAVFDKSIETDRFFVKHARLFGCCALATAVVLVLQIG